MSVQTTKILIAGALLLHGLGHLFAVAIPSLQPGLSVPVRSWLFPSLAGTAARTAASIFWVLSAIGFVAAAMSFWGVLVPGEAWRQLALASSITSILGIVPFLGIWPAFNTLAALGMNIAVLVTQLWLHWPPPALYGK